MKLKMKKIMALIAVGLVSGLLVARPAAAAEMNFAVQAIIPGNQIDKSQTYFDLRMKPGQKQDIEVELRNDTKKMLL
ncbi:WxL protein peptidoglycan domain-containing protein [Listeria aquatica]|uniref:WxL protein peptidoglycan domain-containing protein n=1 Tax=Listeria aquatica TaxID=1494960 RepID=UPI0031F55749